MLTERFEDALQYAARLHATQTRKDTAIPYVAHLLGVASLVIEHGGDEDEAVAALLHDAVEDQGATHAALAARYGARVADIVLGCTDALTQPKPPWRARKESYLAHLHEAPPSVLLVSAADKLHNARAILGDHRRLGNAVFERFSGRRDGTLWYYGALVQAYRRAPALSEAVTVLVDELDRVVSALEARTAEAP